MSTYKTKHINEQEETQTNRDAQKGRKGDGFDFLLKSFKCQNRVTNNVWCRTTDYT